MLGGRRWITVVIASLAFGNLVRAETTLADIEKALEARLKDLRSLTANVKTVSTTPMARSNSKGKIEYALLDGKEQVRYIQEIDYKGPSQSLLLNVELFVDGDQAHSVRVVNGETIVIPQSKDSLLTSPNGRRMLDLAKAGENPAVLPDQEIDGRAMYVVQVDAPTSSPRAYQRLQVFLDKETGLTRRVLGFGPGGAEVLSVDYLDFALNPEIDPERFKFVMPPNSKILNVGQPYVPPSP